MKRNSIKGFTLIEVILSIALLGIIAIFILPMLMYGTKYSKWNNIRLTALNLGYSQVEWLKTLNYDDLGLDLINYSPDGIVRENLYMNDGNSNPLEIQGIEYRLNTNVTWEAAVSSNGEPVATATKIIDVTVEAKDPFTGEKKEYSVLGSLVARESEREPTYPGHLKIYTYFQDVNSPKKNVMVRVSKETGALVSMIQTDGEGRALIGNLTAGIYEVEPVSWEYDEIMIMPNGVINNVSIPRWRTAGIVTVPEWNKNNPPEYPSHSFYIDLPGYIRLPQINNYPNAMISIKPSSGSYNPPEGQPLEHMLLITDIFNLPQTEFWRLWRYDYDISYGDEIYYLTRKEDGTLWNGGFDLSKKDKMSEEELLLSFGLRDTGTFKKSSDGLNEISEIYIEFTSKIDSLESLYNARILLDNSIIDRNEYTIYSVDNKNNKVRIVFNNPIVNITENEISLEIIDFNMITNQYGMKLARDLSKCTLIFTN